MNRLNLFKRDADFKATPIRFISLLSGKGGVGKSLIAYNLAERISAQGLKVLMVDTDFRCGNLHILANVHCDYGMRQFIGGVLSLSEAVTSINDQLDILPTSWNENVLDPSDIMGTAQWIQKLREQSLDYDFVIIDHGSGVSDQITVMAHACDLNLLVLVPEITSIADCYGLYKYLISANENINCRLLINRLEQPDEVEYIRKKFNALSERFLSHTPGYAGYLPESDDFRKAVAAQLPLAVVAPESLALQALNKLCRELVGKTVVNHPDTLNNQNTINKTSVTADI
ncbi:MAG: AAA family ATPase [Candidatus Zixiibacteriota bacterium]